MLEPATLSGVVATLDSATVAEIASLDSVTVSGIVALLDSATANPATNDADTPAVSRMRARRRDMFPPVRGSAGENLAATVTVARRPVTGIVG
jgi:hypothetical protein